MLSSSLSNESKDSMNKLMNDSLNIERGSGDISINGKTNTISHEAVKINGKYFLTLYVISPHHLASDVGKLINQQKNFSTIIIIIIATVAFGIASLVIVWNKRLKTIVDNRTSDLKTANELLKVHDKMQKEFINIASHEIKTPTQALLGFSDLLQKHPENRDQIYEGISRNAKRLHRLTNDILDVTKIESQTLILHKEQFDLIDLLFTILKDFENDIQKKKINIKLLFNSSIHILIEADKERLIQAISNILNNAIKFSSETGGNIFIDITVQKSKNDLENKVLITIKDNGVSIDPDIMPRLFSKFTTKSDSGIGLGLFISKSIIEAHNGKIWAENNNDGIGATFYLILPLL
jgi:signal transduction histidine kinase